MKVVGKVNPRGEPLIRLKLQGNQKSISLIVDTGFNGELCLPRNIIKKLKLELFASEYFELADGNHVLAEVFKGYIEWFGERIKPVEVISTGAQQGLLGPQLLRASILTVDFVKGKVVIERIDSSR